MGKKNSGARLVDIAKKAGIAPSTVSHILRNNTGKNVRISDATRQRVIEIARELNYKPNLAARQLIENSSKMIGVLIDPRPTEENAVRLSEISSYARSKGYHLMILHEAPLPERIHECLNEFSGRGVDGLICVHHVYPKNRTLIPEILVDNFENIVFLDKPAIKGQVFAAADYEKAAYMATEYLLECNYKRIGLAMPDDAWYAAPKMRDGYVKCLREVADSDSGEEYIWVSGKDVDCDLTHVDAGAVERLIDELIIPCKIDALITRDDHWAAQVVNSMRGRGMVVPDDVAVVGCGNWHIARYVQPPLTTIDLHLKAVAQTAVDLLLDQLSGSSNIEERKGIMIEPELIVRESTAQSGADRRR